MDKHTFGTALLITAHPGVWNWNFIIQEEVEVEFDNRRQSPTGFQWRNQHYEVLEVLIVTKD